MPDRLSPDYPAEDSVAPQRGDDSLFAVGSSETICLPGLLLGLYKDYPSLSLVSLAIWRQIQPETEMMAAQSPAPRVPEAPNPLPNQLHPILAPKTPETEVVAPQSPAPRDRKRNRWLFSTIFSHQTNPNRQWWRSCSFLTITRDESFMTISI